MRNSLNNLRKSQILGRRNEYYETDMARILIKIMYQYSWIVLRIFLREYSKTFVFEFSMNFLKILSQKYSYWIIQESLMNTLEIYWTLLFLKFL